MAGLTVTVYTRIRRLSEVDIVELAALMVEGKPVRDFLMDFMAFSIGHEIPDDPVRYMTPAELCEALEAAAKMMKG